MTELRKDSQPASQPGRQLVVRKFADDCCRLFSQIGIELAKLSANTQRNRNWLLISFVVCRNSCFEAGCGWDWCWDWDWESVLAQWRHSVRESWRCELVAGYVTSTKERTNEWTNCLFTDESLFQSLESAQIASSQDPLISSIENLFLLRVMIIFLFFKKEKYSVFPPLSSPLLSSPLHPTPLLKHVVCDQSYWLSIFTPMIISCCCSKLFRAKMDGWLRVEKKWKTKKKSQLVSKSYLHIVLFCSFRSTYFRNVLLLLLWLVRRAWLGLSIHPNLPAAFSRLSISLSLSSRNRKERNGKNDENELFLGIFLKRWSLAPSYRQSQVQAQSPPCLAPN